MTARGLFSIAFPWLLLVAAGLLAIGVRDGLPELAHLCDDGNKPAWCALRAAIVTGFKTCGYGIAALFATSLALILRKPWLAGGAAMLGLFALTLYCDITGALGLLVASLRLVGLQADAVMAAPRHPHRRGDNHVQPQP